MSRPIQEFNSFGPIIRNDPSHPNPDSVPSANEASVAESAAIGRALDAGEAEVEVDEVDERTDEELLELADQKHDAQEVSLDLSPALNAETFPEGLTAPPLTPNDADGDGHDDDNGQFVEGNTEAADEVAAEDAVE